MPAAHGNRRLGFDLLGGFGRRNEVARDLTDEIEKSDRLRPRLLNATTILQATKSDP